jgi:D-alanyl-D-alanine carboxypeptidase
MDDIPEALRDKTKSAQLSRQPSGLAIGGFFGLGTLILLIGAFFLRPIFQSSGNSAPSAPSSDVTATMQPSLNPAPKDVENVLGHLPYPVSPASELVGVTPDGQIRLRKAAARKFIQMQADARANGIILVPISGFRSVAEQEALFFKVKEQRNQNPTKRAEVSAPPGYSEHHTGYAIDIGDGKTPATNLSRSFENTTAFKWLKNSANRYSFELSFPPNNSQGVSYEPWHWRYVGDINSLETFYKARNLQEKSKTDNP